MLADGPLSGFGALRQIRESSPDVKSVILLDGRSPIWQSTHSEPAQRAYSACRIHLQVALQMRGKRPRGTDLGESSRNLLEVMEPFLTCAHGVVNTDGRRR